MHRPARHQKRDREKRKTHFALSRAVEWKWFMWQTRSAVSVFTVRSRRCHVNKQGLPVWDQPRGRCSFLRVSASAEDALCSLGVKEAEGNARTHASFPLDDRLASLPLQRARAENWSVVFGTLDSGGWRKEHKHTLPHKHTGKLLWVGSDLKTLTDAPGRAGLLWS